MGKALFTLELPDPEVRKKQPPAARKHRDRSKYTRKVKHRQAPETGKQFGGFAFLWAGALTTLNKLSTNNTCKFGQGI